MFVHCHFKIMEIEKKTYAKWLSKVLKIYYF
jgi:hypothetical protein